MKIQSIIKQLKKFENQIRKSKSSILFQHTEETLLEEKHILSFIDNQKNVVYMRLPKGEKTYIGFEKTIKHEVNSKEEFINLKNITYHLKNNGLNNDVLLFGAASFNMDKKNSSPWNNIPRGYFFIPSILFTYTNEKSYLTISLSLKNNFSIKETEDKIKNYLDLIQKQFETKNNKKLNLLDKKLLPSKDSYLETLSNIKRKIDRGELNKIVISRIERYIIQNISFKKIITEMNKKYPKCFNFIIKLEKDIYFFGSTPEMLLEIKENKLKTIALAGTSKNKSDLKRDKELEEHNYVVQHLKEILDPFCEEIYVERNAKPLNLEYAYHIQTPISGTLKKETHILDIINKIFPTPALAGSPIDDSIKLIDIIENFDRGWYGGCIGIYDNNGYGNFYVPIRSALIKNKKIYTYSGSGIVGPSKVEREWKETELKFEHLKSVLK